MTTAKRLVLIVLLALALPAAADTFSSTNFQVQAPVLLPGGFSSSSSFKVISTLDLASLGFSASASFGLRPGFLPYPFVSTPVVSATAGTGSVALSWSAANGYLGWSPSAYAVGQSTVSGGPYSFTNVGNVTSSARTGLSGGTPYYFVLRVLDAFGNILATSTEVSATPTSSGGSGGGGSGGGSSGGGGGGGTGTGLGGGSIVYFSGRAYPNSTVTLLKDAQVVASTVAGSDAKFQVSVSVGAGNFIFSVYGEDSAGNRSSLLTFPVSVTGTTNTNVTGIFIAPTIDTDKAQVKQGDNIAIFGQSAPKSDVVIFVNSDNELFLQAHSDDAGAYLYTLDTSPLELGSHTAKSKAAVQTEISSFGAAVGFTVGTQNVAKTKTASTACKRGDLNCDGKINLVDFSIMAYWYKKPLSGTGLKADLNSDGKVDLTDFSVLVFYWTG